MKIMIDQVVIGSCTNGRLSDLRKAAAILKGKQVAKNVRVMVVPATQKIFVQCIHEGLAEIFVEAGCAFNTPSCGPCMGGHMGVMAKGEKCVSTTNRNFVSTTNRNFVGRHRSVNLLSFSRSSSRKCNCGIYCKS